MCRDLPICSPIGAPCRLMLVRQSLFARGLPNVRPPVLICPYVHDHEEEEIRSKFGLVNNSQIEAFLYRDTKRVGPERAFEYCWSKYPDRDIVIIHSDMAPIGPAADWWNELVSFRERLPTAGMIACNLLYPKDGHPLAGQVQCAGGSYQNGVIDYLRGPIVAVSTSAQNEVTEEQLCSVRRVDWVTFGGVLIRREVLNACGAIDGSYRWAYYMDVDYCLEARLRGFQLFQVPVCLTHEESRSTRPRWEQDAVLRESMHFNEQYFHEKWRQRGGALTSA